MISRFSSTFALAPLAAGTLIFSASTAPVHALALEGPGEVTFADCAALDGQETSSGFYGGGASEFTVSQRVIVTELSVNDVVDIEVTEKSGGGSRSSEATIIADGVQLLSKTFSTADRIGQGSITIPGDISNYIFELETVFFGGELEHTYVFNCTPGEDTVDPDPDPDSDDTTDPDADEPVTSIDLTQDVIAAFITQRMDLLVQEGPDRLGSLRDQLQPLVDSDSASFEPEDDVDTQAAFFRAPDGPRSSIVDEVSRPIWTFPADLPTTQPVGTTSEIPIPPPLPEPARRSCWEAWAELHYARFQDAGDRSGDFVVGYAGVDCLVHSSTIVGILAQVDWMQDEIGAVDAKTDGVGWMVGPYSSVRLTDNLFFDVRAAWGQSNNNSNVNNVTADFDTTRWLVEASLSGDFIFEDIRITPEIGISYIQERQEAYTTSAGIDYDAVTHDLGRLTFGPEIARRFDMGTGVAIEPSIAFRGLWDFEAAEAIVSGFDYSVEGLRGVVELGLLLEQTDSFSVRFAGKYDGLGRDNYESVSGQVRISIPF